MKVDDAAAHEDESFRAAVEAHRPKLIRYGLRRLSDRQAVEDLVADTFLAAWSNWNEKPPTEDERLYWLYAIAHRVLLNMLRGQYRRRELRAKLERNAASTEEGWESQSESMANLIAIIGTLSTDDREALHLAYWEGLSYREIGLVLGCSENAVALRLSRVRRRLRKQLDESKTSNHQ